MLAKDDCLASQSDAPCSLGRENDLPLLFKEVSLILLTCLPASWTSGIVTQHNSGR